MYKLSSLPIEILYMISGFLETKDLITLARLNTWFSYRLSPLLSERIYKDVESDGWRIHVSYTKSRAVVKMITNIRLYL